MGKYEPLAQYLNHLDDESWEARLEDIERVLGFKLPDSAYTYPAWWANQHGHHSQTKGWRDVGWETRDVDLRSRRVRFVRSNKRREQQARNIEETLDMLIERATRIAGIDDREELVRTAVMQLLQRHTARRLIALGGTMPNAEAPPRRRFD